jgi:hypothetical protein
MSKGMVVRSDDDLRRLVRDAFGLVRVDRENNGVRDDCGGNGVQDRCVKAGVQDDGAGRRFLGDEG